MLQLDLIQTLAFFVDFTNALIITGFLKLWR